MVQHVGRNAVGQLLLLLQPHSRGKPRLTDGVFLATLSRRRRRRLLFLQKTQLLFYPFFFCHFSRFHALEDMQELIQIPVVPAETTGAAAQV